VWSVVWCCVNPYCPLMAGLRPRGRGVEGTRFTRCLPHRARSFSSSVARLWNLGVRYFARVIQVVIRPSSGVQHYHFFLNGREIRCRRSAAWSLAYFPAIIGSSLEESGGAVREFGIVVAGAAWDGECTFSVMAFWAVAFEFV